MKEALASHWAHVMGEHSWGHLKPCFYWRKIKQRTWTGPQSLVHLLRSWVLRIFFKKIFLFILVKTIFLLIDSYALLVNQWFEVEIHTTWPLIWTSWLSSKYYFPSFILYSHIFQLNYSSSPLLVGLFHPILSFNFIFFWCRRPHVVVLWKFCALREYGP